MIKNLKLREDAFYQYLFNNAILLQSDTVFDYNNSDVDYDDVIYNYKIHNTNQVFLYDGIPNDEILSIARLLFPKKSFNIGVCTKNDIEYGIAKIRYDQIKEKLLKINQKTYCPIKTYDSFQDNHKVYVLSYRY